MEMDAFCPLANLIPTSERIAFEERDLPLATVAIFMVGVEMVGVEMVGVEMVGVEMVGAAGELALVKFREILGDEKLNSSAQTLSQVPSLTTEVSDDFLAPDVAVTATSLVKSASPSSYRHRASSVLIINEYEPLVISPK